MRSARGRCFGRSTTARTRRLVPLLLPLVVLVFVQDAFPASSASSSSRRKVPYYRGQHKRQQPISLKDGLLKLVERRWNGAAALAELEQSVEDYNAEWIACSGGQAQAVRHRRLIALPLDDGFDPPMGVFSHGHVQTGDKMSLPPNFWQAIQLNEAEVPWLFRVSRIDDTVTGRRVEFKKKRGRKGSGGDKQDEEGDVDEDDEGDDEDVVITPHVPMREDLNSVVGGPLDFRAPSCYVFLPWWMMRALGLKPRDVVEVELVSDSGSSGSGSGGGAVAPGSLAKLRPHSSQFGRDISNPQAVLETELRHYSSLVQGSTIAFDYNKKRYWFDVVELRSSPRGEKVPAIKVQDCDIATDFLPAKDTLKKRKKKKPARRDDEL